MLNKIMIIGNLGRNPDVSQTQGGTTVARLSVAVSRHWTERSSGERKEDTTWFTAIAYDHLAQTAQQYLHTGSRVYLEGRMQSRRYTDRDGSEHTAWEIVASDLQLLDPKPADQEAPAPAPTATAQTPQQEAPATAPAPAHLTIDAFCKTVQRDLGITPKRAMEMLGVKSLSGLNLDMALSQLRDAHNSTPAPAQAPAPAPGGSTTHQL